MLVFQLLLVVFIAWLAASRPADQLTLIATLAVCIAFLSASQDVVIDAYRAEILPPEERGAGSSMTILGYRLALLVSSSLALIMADHMSWNSVYLAMSACMVIGIATTLFAPEPRTVEPAPHSLKEAVVDPFLEYFRRRGAWEILAFVILYKIGDVLAGSLSTTFLLQKGFTKTEIGAISKGAGLFATIFGAMLGGGLMARLSLKSSLICFGVLQAVSTLGFAVLAAAEPSQWMLAGVIVGENLSGGMGTAAQVAFLISLCNKRFTATQYALLTSLAAVTATYAGAFTGLMVESLGWTAFFVVCVGAAVPGLVLVIFRYDAWEDGGSGASLEHSGESE